MREENGPLITDKVVELDITLSSLSFKVFIKYKVLASTKYALNILVSLPGAVEPSLRVILYMCMFLIKKKKKGEKYKKRNQYL